MASITAIVDRFKADPQSFLTDAYIHEACVEAGHRWRKRLLEPVADRGRCGLTALTI